ncbi:MAG: HAD family hydrolase [Desulfovibrio sp.]|nr:HAD family hydrolase [Desulfovibrio sp.]
MSPQAFLFDLDGTLLDTLADLGSACNRMLAAHGWPEHPVDAYRRMIGDGFVRLVERALPPDILPSLRPGQLDRLVREGKEAYSAHLKDATRPYPGMPDAVAELRARGCRLGVLSNKPDPQTRELVETFFPGCFHAVHGGRQGVPLKPDPAAALAMLGELGTDRTCTWYVGDSDVDMITARHAGLAAIGVAWGFRGEAEVAGAGAARIVRHPSELCAFAGIAPPVDKTQ